MSESEKPGAGVEDLDSGWDDDDLPPLKPAESAAKRAASIFDVGAAPPRVPVGESPGERPGAALAPRAVPAPPATPLVGTHPPVLPAAGAASPSAAAAPAAAAKPAAAPSPLPKPAPA